MSLLSPTSTRQPGSFVLGRAAINATLGTAHMHREIFFLFLTSPSSESRIPPSCRFHVFAWYVACSSWSSLS